MAISSPMGKLFGTSPIRPLQQHMRMIEESAQLLSQLMEAANDGSDSRVSEIHNALDIAIRESQSMLRDIRARLPRSLLLAVPRPDLINLLAVQGRIGDTLRRTGRLVYARSFVAPPKVRGAVARLMERLLRAMEEALLTIEQLDELIAVGFDGREARRVERLLEAMNKTLERADQLSLRAQQQLARHEGSIAAPEALTCFRVVEHLDEIVSQTREIAEQLELLLAH